MLHSWCMSGSNMHPNLINTISTFYLLGKNCIHNLNKYWKFKQILEENFINLHLSIVGEFSNEIKV